MEDEKRRLIREFDSLIGEMPLDSQEETRASMGAIHEMFLNMVRAGFTTDHALRIIAYGLFQRPEDPPDL